MARRRKFKRMTYTDYSPEIQSLMKEARIKCLENVGDYLEGKAKLLCPVGQKLENVKPQTTPNIPQGYIGNGNLRDSLTHDVNVEEMGVKIGTPWKYGIYVEKGTGLYAKEGNGRKTPWTYVNQWGEFVTTHGQKPQPFLAPSFKTFKTQAKAIMTRTFRKEMKGVEGLND